MKTIAQQLNIKEFPFRIYDNNENEVYYEKSDGYWSKYEFDSNGNETYYQNSDGFWWKYEFDSNGNPTYYGTSDGYWCKRGYDSAGNEIYFENSYGDVMDKRPKSCEGKIVEIDGIKYELKAIK